MAQGSPLLTKEQWSERLQTWAVERWGQARAQTIRDVIEETAQHLVTVADYSLGMEQMPAFFIKQS